MCSHPRNRTLLPVTPPWTPYPKPEPGHIHVFTDGSFWEGRRGIAYGSLVGVPNPKQVAAWCAMSFATDEEGHTTEQVHKGLCDVDSSMKSELYAIVRAFGIIPEGMPGAIICDAEINDHLLKRWADNKFLNSKGKPLKLREERMKIWMLRTMRSEINLIQVKGHSQISQQEQTDRAVRGLLRKEISKRGWDRSDVQK